jgi:hypothetical protein
MSYFLVLAILLTVIGLASLVRLAARESRRDQAESGVVAEYYSLERGTLYFLRAITGQVRSVFPELFALGLGFLSGAVFLIGAFIT